MPKKLIAKSTLHPSDHERRPPKESRDARMLIAARFRLLCDQAGLRVADVAQTLHVTERTVRHWFSGATAVPYSAYRLLRVLNRFELPGWPGWVMHSGKLWTPEGFSFEPGDAAWWSLIVRQARCFRAMYQRSGMFERALLALGAEGLPGAQPKDVRTLGGAQGGREAPRPAALAGGRREAPAPNLFQSHIATERDRDGVRRGVHA